MEYSRKFYSHGVPLEMEIVLPESREQNLEIPAVILCHGHSRHRNDGLHILAETLAECGIAAFRFNFRGCGKNASNKYFEYCASEWPYDLIQAINYVQTLPFIDRERIGVAGISMGACTTIYTAGMDKRVKSLVSMSGIGDCRQWMEYVWKSQGGDFTEFEKTVYERARISAATGSAHMVNVLDMYHFPEKDRKDKIIEGFLDDEVSEYIAWETMQELLMYKPIEHCSQISQPIFFLVGGEDFLVPKEQSENMYQAVASSKKKFKEYPGVEHNIPVDPQCKTAFADIATWFCETL